MKRRYQRWFSTSVMVLIGLMFLAIPAGAIAGAGTEGSAPEDENPSQFYDSILYAEIASRLDQIQSNSRSGKSRGYWELGWRTASLFLVTVSEPDNLEKLEYYQNIRHLMLTNPKQAGVLHREFRG